MEDSINESRFEYVLNTNSQITGGIVIKDLIEKYNQENNCVGDMCEVTWHPDKKQGE